MKLHKEKIIDDYVTKKDIVDEYEISMVLDTRNNPIDLDTLLMKFIEWVEMNNFYCGGTIYPLNEKGERIL